jgi:hypothetical protein
MYSSRKRKWAADFATIVSYVGTNLYFKTNFDNLDYFQEVQNNPFFLIPKHQHLFDVPFTALALHKGTKRRGHYIMKDDLPEFLELCGGIRVKRIKDLENMEEFSKLPKERARAIIREANQIKKEVYGNILPKLIEKGDPIISYVEGERRYKEPHQVQSSDFVNLMSVQKKVGKQIAFVPLDIDYDSLKFRANVNVRVGEPIKVKDDDLESLVNHFRDQIELFY